MTLKTAKGCPECGATDSFDELNIIEGIASISSFNDDGSPEYGGETEVLWNTQKVTPNKDKYMCCHCKHWFAEPVDVTYEENEDVEN